MTKSFYPVVLSLGIIFLLIILAFVAKEKKNLRMENDRLKLKNDSLHVEQIDTRKQLERATHIIDSIIIKSSQK